MFKLSSMLLVGLVTVASHARPGNAQDLQPVRVTIENPYPRELQVKSVTDDRGAESVPPKSKKTLNGYFPGDVIEIKRELHVVGTWNPFDRFTVGSQPEQYRLAVPGHRSIDKLKDGRIISLSTGDRTFLCKVDAANAKDGYRLESRITTTNHLWRVHRGLLGEGWTFELLEDGDQGRLLGLVEHEGAYRLRLVDHPDLDDEEQCANVRWIPLAVRPEVGDGFALKSANQRPYSSDTGYPKGAFIKLLDGPSVFSAGSWDQYSVEQRNSPTGLIQAFNVTPLVEDSGTLENKDYDDWVRNEQNLLRIQKNWGEETDEGTFAGERMEFAGHSLEGYNVLRMNPHDLSDHGTSEIPIFRGVSLSSKVASGADAKEWYLDSKSNYRVPAAFRYANLNNSEIASDITHSYFSEDEYRRSLSVHVGVKGSYGPGSAGVGFDHSENRSNKHSQNKVTTVQQHWNAVGWLFLDKTDLRLSPEFVDFVNSMDESDYGNYVQLFEQFGTHYPLCVLYGSHSATISHVDAHEVAKTIEQETKVSAQGGLGSEKEDAKNPQAGKKPEKNTGPGASVDVSVSAGSYEGHQKKSQAEDSETYGKGADGANPYPLKVDLRPIGEIIRPELIGGDVDSDTVIKFNRIRARSEQFLAHYLEQEGNKLVNRSSQLPRVYLANVKLTCDKAKDRTGDGIEGKGPNAAPDMAGSIYIQVHTVAANGSSESKQGAVQTVINLEQITVDEGDSIEDAMAYRPSFIKEKTNELFSDTPLCVLPVTRKVTRNQVTYLLSRYDMSQHKLMLRISLFDYDRGSTDWAAETDGPDLIVFDKSATEGAQQTTPGVNAKNFEFEHVAIGPTAGITNVEDLLNYKEDDYLQVLLPLNPLNKDTEATWILKAKDVNNAAGDFTIEVTLKQAGTLKIIPEQDAGFGLPDFPSYEYFPRPRRESTAGN